MSHPDTDIEATESADPDTIDWAYHTKHRTPFINYANKYDQDEVDTRRLIRLHQWELNHDFEGDSHLREPRDVLTDLFDKEPVEHKNFEYRTAAWKFCLDNGAEFLVLWSYKGLSVEVDLGLDAEQLNGVLDFLEDKLNPPDRDSLENS